MFLIFHFSFVESISKYYPILASLILIFDHCSCSIIYQKQIWLAFNAVSYCVAVSCHRVMPCHSRLSSRRDKRTCPIRRIPGSIVLAFREGCQLKSEPSQTQEALTRMRNPVRPQASELDVNFRLQSSSQADGVFRMQMITIIMWFLSLNIQISTSLQQDPEIGHWSHFCFSPHLSYAVPRCIFLHQQTYPWGHQKFYSHFPQQTYSWSNNDVNPTWRPEDWLLDGVVQIFSWQSPRKPNSIKFTAGTQSRLSGAGPRSGWSRKTARVGWGRPQASWKKCFSPKIC